MQNLDSFNCQAHDNIATENDADIAAAQIPAKFTERTATRRREPRATDIINERRQRVAELEYMLSMMRLGVKVIA